MTVASYLLLAVGLLGAVDIALFHSVAHGIRTHPNARQELIVHSLRGPTYAALFLVVPNVVLRGLFLWALLALLAFDLALSIWDFAIERESRRFLGGIPTGEYILHVLIAMCFGAMVAAVCFEAGSGMASATAVILRPAVSGIVRLVFAVMAVGVLWSGFLDARAAARLWKVPSR